jgi:hypothetical protein
MMDAVVPGGVARDFAPSCAATVAALLEDVRRLFPQLVELDDNTAWLQDRTATTGILRSELARQFGAGGYVGRASGRASIRARCSPIRKILSTLCRRKCSLKRTETPTTQSVRAFHSNLIDGTRSSASHAVRSGRANGTRVRDPLAWEDAMVIATENRTLAAEHHRVAGICRSPEFPPTATRTAALNISRHDGAS